MIKMINDLINIGLTQYEAKAYAALIKQNNLTANEIIEMSGIPQGKIYSVLNDLINKGFCYFLPGPKKKYSANNPKQTIKKLIDENENKIQLMQEIAGNLGKVFEQQSNQQTPLNYIKIYTSKTGLIEKINDMSLEASKSFITFNKPPYSNFNYNNPEKSISHDLVLNIKSRGVDIREIWQIDYERLDKFINWVKHMEKLGVKARVIESLPIKFMAADHDKLLFLLKNNEISRNIFTSMFIEHSDLVEVFSGMFELYWKKAISIEDFCSQIENNEK